MKGVVNIMQYSSDDEFEYDTVLNPYFDFSLSIMVDDENDIEKKIKDKKKALESLRKSYDLADTYNMLNADLKKKFEYIISNFDSILDSVEFFYITMENIDYKEYLKNNPILLTKKIVLPIGFELTQLDDAINLRNEYNDIKDKLYVFLAYNDSFVSIDECIKTMSYIKNQAEQIKKYNLSPLENTMLVYDIVRNRKYMTENNSEGKYVSRDLSSVLFGDKIVCKGFANYFSALLRYLNIKSEVVTLSKINSNSGHARNVAYINDDKYSVNGVYYFDPTWDCNNFEDNSYLYFYKYFALTRKQEDSINKKDKYLDDSITKYFSTFDEYFEFYKNASVIDKIKFFEKPIRHIGKLVLDKNLIDDKLSIKFLSGIDVDFNSLKSELDEILPLFNKPIEKQKLLDLLINVRSVEYQMNPNWYPFDFKAIVDTCYNSKLIRNATPEERLFALVYGQEINMVKIFYNENEDKLRKIEEQRLVNTLKNVLVKRRK